MLNERMSNLPQKTWDLVSRPIFNHQSVWQWDDNLRMWIRYQRICMRVSQCMRVAPNHHPFQWDFPQQKPSSYGGTPMTMEIPIWKSTCFSRSAGQDSPRCGGSFCRHKASWQQQVLWTCHRVQRSRFAIDPKLQKLIATDHLRMWNVHSLFISKFNKMWSHHFELVSHSLTLHFCISQQSQPRGFV